MTITKPKVRHHVVPQFYLKKFSFSAGSASQVYVTFVNEGKIIPVNTINVCMVKHFNSVEISGLPPDILEDALSEIESIISPHLNNVIQTKKNPRGATLDAILHLIALLSVRTGHLRSEMSRMLEWIGESVGSHALRSRESWEAIVQEMKDGGYEVNDSVSYEDMKTFEAHGYDISVDQTYLIGHEIEAVKTVFGLLKQRKWRLLKAPLFTDFITSDNPVILKWMDGVQVPLPPGHAHRKSKILFPLSPKVAIEGIFSEKKLTNRKLSSDEVAEINGDIFMYARKQVVSCLNDYVLSSGGRFVDLREVLESRRREYGRSGR